ncbi:hypothetical protein N7G274_006422 [Stereocaulon virgatum]|uniref:F-box domain-containing protein n=1 Tax=Stereocaulon virgatum TaxID=373712 RepID=A0ABR4A4Y6_9LECA
MQHTVEATSTTSNSTITKHTQEPKITPFQLLDLPRELRDRIYSFAVASRRSHHKLTGQPSDWFNPAILGVNHQVNKEASEAIFKTEIKILLNYHTIETCYSAQWRSMLSERLSFDRCNVHLDVGLPNTGRHNVFVPYVVPEAGSKLDRSLDHEFAKNCHSLNSSVLNAYLRSTCSPWGR